MPRDGTDGMDMTGVSSGMAGPLKYRLSRWRSRLCLSAAFGSAAVRQIELFQVAA
jgi:hypothetical protein